MSANELIQLNVGGIFYTTTKSTLCKYSDSMLGAMFSDSFPTTRDQNGSVFIDRDGEVFKYVLNFLRSSKLSLPSDFKDLDLLQSEADFYQIRPLIQSIQILREEMSKSNYETYSIEIIEVRTGSNATMPTRNSRVKTIISGRVAALMTIPDDFLDPEVSEKLECKSESEFIELELTGSNIRLELGEVLQNGGWQHADSSFSSSSGYHSNFIIEHSYRDRWTTSVSKVKNNTCDKSPRLPRL